jgi:hypothetical protein
LVRKGVKLKLNGIVKKIGLSENEGPGSHKKNLTHVPLPSNSEQLATLIAFTQVKIILTEEIERSLVILFHPVYLNEYKNFASIEKVCQIFALCVMDCF